MSIYDDLIDTIIGGDELNENIRIGDGEILSEDDTEGINKEFEDSKNNETSKKKVEPKKQRSVRNPRPRLNIETLTGQRGIHTIENYFQNIKFQGKGYEKYDLDEILKRLKHWAHRMYPSYKFDDILITVERLSKKKQLQNYMYRYRQGLLNENDKEIEHNDNDNDDIIMNNQELDEPYDEFDALINQQIANSKLPLPSVPVTPNHTITTINHIDNNENNTSIISSVLDTPRFIRGHHGQTSTPHHHQQDLEMIQEDEEMDMNAEINSHIFQTPKQYQQPSTSKASEAIIIQKKTNDIPEFLKNRNDLTAEQIAKIAENRRLAQEKLKAKKSVMNFQ